MHHALILDELELQLNNANSEKAVILNVKLQKGVEGNTFRNDSHVE